MTTTYTDQPATHGNRTLLAALGVGIAVVLTALGTFWDFNGNDTNHDGLGAYLVVVGIIVVAAAIVFGLVVRPEAASAGTRALVLGVLAVLTLVVSWSGLPTVLAAGAAACALGSGARRADGAIGGAGKAALVLSGAALAGAVVFAFIG